MRRMSRGQRTGASASVRRLPVGETDGGTGGGRDACRMTNGGGKGECATGVFLAWEVGTGVEGGERLFGGRFFSVSLGIKGYFLIEKTVLK